MAKRKGRIDCEALQLKGMREPCSPPVVHTCLLLSCHGERPSARCRAEQADQPVPLACHQEACERVTVERYLNAVPTRVQPEIGNRQESGALRGLDGQVRGGLWCCTGARDASVRYSSMVTGLLAHSPSVLTRVIGSRLLVLGTTGDVRVLEGTARIVWEALTEPTSTTALCSELATIFGVTPEQVREDVTPLVTDLLEVGVLVELP
jgi:hypothetical protein